MAVGKRELRARRRSLVSDRGSLSAGDGHVTPGEERVEIKGGRLASGVKTEGEFASAVSKESGPALGIISREKPETEILLMINVDY